jgi:diaminopimelate decarboxylase
MQLSDNKYTIQGVELTQLGKEYGTPLYVYDAHKISSQVNRIRSAFATVNLQIKYACKALTSVAVLKHICKLGIGIDVVSPQELDLALLAGFQSNKITFTPSGVAWQEIVYAVDKGVIVNLDNLSVLERFGQEYGNSQTCMLRIKPNIAAGGHSKIMTAHEGSKFGISILQTEQILAVIKKYDIKVVGLHQHTGSDIQEASTFIAAAQALYSIAEQFPDLQQIDFGGGFKVPYREGDTETDMPALGAAISASFQDFCQKYGRTLQLWFEPGKFLVSEAGLLLAQTNVVKNDPSATFIGLNSGLNHLIRPMMYDAYHEIINLTNTDSSQKQNYNVVGYICETDTFATQRSINTVSEGDILCFKNAGAYGYSMSSQYNSRLRPAEVLIENGKATLIRKRETLDDILANQVY